MNTPHGGVYIDSTGQLRNLDGNPVRALAAGYSPASGDYIRSDGSIGNFDELGGGGEGGATNYNSLSNKPQIGGVVLQGNKTAADLGLVTAADFATKVFANAEEYNSLQEFLTGETPLNKTGKWIFPTYWEDLPVQGEQYIIDITQAGDVFDMVAYNLHNMRTDRGIFDPSQSSDVKWTYMITERIEQVEAIDYATLSGLNLPLQRLVGIKSQYSYMWVYQFQAGIFMTFGCVADTNNNVIMKTKLITAAGGQDWNFVTEQYVQDLAQRLSGKIAELEERLLAVEVAQ